MLGEAEFDNVVQAIGEAGLQPATWAIALERMTASLGAECGGVGLLGGAASTFRWRGYSEKTVDAYVTNFARYSPSMTALATHPVGQPYTEDLYETRAGYLKGVFYNEWARPAGNEACLMLPASRGAAGLRWAVVARGPGCPPFDDGDLAVVRRLAPHLARANIMNERLADAGRMAFTGFDRTGEALLASDTAGRLIHVNAVAEALIVSGRLATNGAGKARALTHPVLRKALSLAARSGGQGAMLRLDKPGEPVLAAIVSPWIEPPGGVEPLALVLVVGGPRSEMSSATARQLFGLTAAEATVAGLAIAGGGVPEVADRLGVSRNTARTHLNRVFAKTGTRNQVALTRLWTRLGAGFPLGG